jgi:hypothetical protein
VQNALTHNALSRLGTTHAEVGDGFSKPTGTLAGYQAADTAFPLSSGEAINFMARYKISQKGSTTDMYGSQQTTNWLALNDETSYITFLRSPGYDLTRVSQIYDTGYIVAHDLGYTRSVRPALWVKSSIFD